MPNIPGSITMVKGGLIYPLPALQSVQEAMRPQFQFPSILGTGAWQPRGNASPSMLGLASSCCRPTPATDLMLGLLRIVLVSLRAAGEPGTIGLLRCSPANGQ